MSIKDFLKELRTAFSITSGQNLVNLRIRLYELRLRTYLCLKVVLSVDWTIDSDIVGSKLFEWWRKIGYSLFSGVNLHL